MALNFHNFFIGVSCHGRNVVHYLYFTFGLHIGWSLHGRSRSTSTICRKSDASSSNYGRNRLLDFVGLNWIRARFHRSLFRPRTFGKPDEEFGNDLRSGCQQIFFRHCGMYFILVTRYVKYKNKPLKVCIYVFREVM